MLVMNQNLFHLMHILRSGSGASLQHRHHLMIEGGISSQTPTKAMQKPPTALELLLLQQLPEENGKPKWKS